MAHVLLVDDDEVLRVLMERLLSLAGHTVKTAEDGAAGLALATTESFDLVITDVMMPKMDGYELTRHIRANPALRATRVLVLTSRMYGPDPELAKAAGADAWSMKAVTAARLNQLVDAILAPPSAG